MTGRIRQMLVKEFIQLFRDARMRTVLIGPPIIQLIIFGYAATTDVRNVPTAVYDLDNSVSSRELVSRFVESGYFDIEEYIFRPERARELLDRGDVSTVLHMRKGFGEDLKEGRTAEVQIIVDGTDSTTAGVVLSYSGRIVEQFSQQTLRARLVRMRGSVVQAGGVDMETRAWFNENLESRNFYVPGVIGLLVTLITLLLTSMAVVREKEIGTMEQIMVTPITRWEFLLGKTLPFFIIGIAETILVAFIGVSWFQVPIRGNPALLLFGTAIYMLTALGVGLLISTVSQTQQQAMMTTFFYFFPAILLSGFVFPIANMPVIIQWLTYLNPLRYFMVILRGIFLKGIAMDVLWPQFACLAVLGVAMLWLASSRLSKTLA